MQPQAVSCGTPFLLVPLRDRAAVSRSRIKLDLWETALREYMADKVLVFAMEAAAPNADIRARMYAPGINVAEDPATGSAACCVAGYLAARDPRFDGTLRWTIEQGVEMGRPSILEIEADKKGGKVTATRVGGQTVLVCEGMMSL